MKYRIGTLVAIGVILGSAIPARADVSVSFSTGRSYRYDRNTHARFYYGPPAYYPPRRAFPRYVAYRPYSRVVVAPVVVSQPYYVADYPSAPVVTPPVSSGYSGDYGQDLSNFRERLSRLRAVLEKQREKDVLPKEIYTRLSDALDGIEHDQRVRAFDRGGNLESGDFSELNRRLDQTATDIEVALAG